MRRLVSGVGRDEEVERALDTRGLGLGMCEDSFRWTRRSRLAQKAKAWNIDEAVPDTMVTVRLMASRGAGVGPWVEDRSARSRASRVAKHSRGVISTIALAQFASSLACIWVSKYDSSALMLLVIVCS